MSIKKCIICSAEFSTGNYQKTCSDKCAKERRNAKRRVDHPTALCKMCGTEFKPSNRTVVTCSQECKKAARESYRQAYEAERKDHYRALRRKADRKRYESRKEERKDYNKKYREENKETLRIKKRDYHREKRREDPQYRIKCNLRARLYGALKGKDKAAPTIELLGCSIDQMRQHLENQFTEGMTWENYGRGGWEVDHAIPCAAWDLTLPEDQRMCFHYTNLQPMWADENRLKRERW